MKVILYDRSATTKDPFEINSVEHQLQRLHLHCKKLKYQVAGVYCDVGCGSEFNRPEWQLLMSDLENHIVISEAIICTSTDKLSRTKTETRVVFEELLLYGINMNYLDKPYDIWIELKRIRKSNKNILRSCKQLSIQE